MDRGNLKYFRKPADVLLFFRIFLSLVFLRILIPFVDITRIIRWIEPSKGRKLDPDRLHTAVLFSNIILRRILRTSRPCMVRSLVLFRYIRAMGEDVKLVFGVKKGLENTLQGHAWLIYEGKQFPEKEDPGEEYQVMAVFPQPTGPDEGVLFGEESNGKEGKRRF